MYEDSNKMELPLLEARVDVLKETVELRPTVVGYKSTRWRKVCFYFACLLTLGIVWLLAYWFPHVTLKLFYKRCRLEDASRVLIQDKQNKRSSVALIYSEIFKSSNLSDGIYSLDRFTGADCIQFYTYRFAKYVFDRKSESFIRLAYPTVNAVCERNTTRGLDKDDVTTLKAFYGENNIVVPQKSCLRIFFDLAFNPLYIFQLITICLWAYEGYYSFSGFIAGASLISLLILTILTKRRLNKLSKMVAGTSPVCVLRNNSWQVVSSENLVPGDLIQINDKEIFPCDAVIVSGNCAVDESMLTGESVPVMKISVTPDDVIVNEQPHTLFSGSNICRVYASGKAQAVVLRTGYATVKGKLVKDLLLSDKSTNHYYGDFFKFILVLSTPAMLGFALTLYFFIRLGTSVDHIIIRALNITSVIIPPDLPVIIAVGIIFSAWRLRKQQIFCIDLPTISLCGRISVFCFDKTGTLTDSKFVVDGVVPLKENKMGDAVRESHSLQQPHLLAALACCHSLVLTDETLQGDELEVAMWKFVDWSLQAMSQGPSPSRIFYPRQQSSDDVSRNGYEILRTFPFESSLGCMSCIVKETESNSVFVFSKGAPEKIASNCDSNSIPSNFDDALDEHTGVGCRVLAIAIKKLEGSTCEKLTRNEAERNLEMIGLVLFRDSLREATKPAIAELKQANIRVIMVTGDHVLTAVSVGRECGIINPDLPVIQLHAVDSSIEERAVGGNKVHSEGQYVVTGDVFDTLEHKYPATFERLLLRGAVFARMSPTQKSRLVQSLHDLDYCVGMCGDGANDCGALKAADVGISLSEAEASVASPFTCKTNDISCCNVLIKQGRACLVTATSLFLFIIVAAFDFSTSLLILFSIDSSLSDFAAVYNYFFQVVPFTVAILSSRASPLLHPKKPPMRLFRLVLILTVLVVILIQAATFLFGFFLVRASSWYKPPSAFKNQDQNFQFKNYESTTVFNILNFQTVLLPAIFYEGIPYIQPLYRNKSLTVILILSLMLVSAFILIPWPHMQDLFMLVSYPRPVYRLYILLICLSGGFLSFLVAKIGMRSKHFRAFVRILKRKKHSAKKYKVLLGKPPQTQDGKNIQVSTQL